MLDWSNVRFVQLNKFDPSMLFNRQFVIVGSTRANRKRLRRALRKHFPSSKCVHVIRLIRRRRNMTQRQHTLTRFWIIMNTECEAEIQWLYAHIGRFVSGCEDVSNDQAESLFRELCCYQPLEQCIVIDTASQSRQFHNKVFTLSLNDKSET